MAMYLAIKLRLLSFVVMSSQQAKAKMEQIMETTNSKAQEEQRLRTHRYSVSLIT